MPKPSVFAAIRSENVQRTDFKVYKDWIADNTGYSSSGYGLFQAIHTSRITPIDSPDPQMRASGFYPTNSFDGSYQTVIWKSVDHAFYSHPYNPTKTLENDQADKNVITKFLFLSASILTFPYFKIGEKIKPGSLTLNETAGNYTLRDDGNGNLRDDAITTSSFAPSGKLVAYWGFNDEFRRFKTSYGTVADRNDLIFESNTFQPNIKSTIKNVTFNPGIKTTDTLKSSGIQADFNGNGFIKTNNFEDINFRTNDDFAISLWVHLPVSQSVTGSTTNCIISKRRVQDVTQIVKRKPGQPSYSSPGGGQGSVITKEINKTLARYPYFLRVYNQTNGSRSGKLIFSRRSGATKWHLTSSMAVTGSHRHIIVQKTGSLIEMYIDGVLNNSGSTGRMSFVNNKAKVMFGAESSDLLPAPHMSGELSGSLDEIRFYKNALSQDNISSLANNHFLSSSAYQTNVIGNTFYKLGHMIVSSPLPQYHGAMSGSWNVTYKSTHKICENKVLVQIPQGSFNVSLNPTATYQPSTNPSNTTTTATQTANGPGEFILPEFTASLRPYISTIGLYDSSARLLAVGKLPQAIQKRDDIDMNFVIRWDY